MYYNSNKNNNDYYNSYKKEIAELKAHRKEERSQKIIKLILSFLTLVLLIIVAFYINNKKLLITKKLLPVILIKEELPQSIQLSEYNIPRRSQIDKSAMTERNIELIVKIIMAKMNTKVEKTLEKQLREVHNKALINKSLKKTNHYNKIVLRNNKNNQIKNISLVQLTTKLNSIINEEESLPSNYTRIIQKEANIHKNEMRIIIVQKGDTLSRIAKKAYGSYDDYPKILLANPEIIKNQNQISVGQRLRIPS